MSALLDARAQSLFAENQRNIFVRTDRMFAGLMILQWIGCAAAAIWISPRAWEGTTSAVHPHVLAALILGAAISILPVVLVTILPGSVLTRQTIAACQMLMSALLIHVTGGRIETHFHVFGSLAFLAFYRDWRVLATATVVVAADHILRGTYWPQSVFGVASSTPWRWVEHAGWVAFEDLFLLLATQQSIDEMRQTASRQSLLEDVELRLREAHDGLERKVAERTAALDSANADLVEQISERERAEEAVRWQAYHDVLTGLPNRNVFHDRLEQVLAIGRAQDVTRGGAVMKLALDRFTHINDSVGHEEGDRLLCEVAVRLCATLRGTDTIARVSGDEFVVLLPDIEGPHESAAAGQAMLDALSNPIESAGQRLYVGASVGISVFPDDSIDADSLMRYASAAVRRCKEQGGGCVHFYAEGMEAAGMKQLALESDLRQALARQEFVVYYQPQVEARSGRIVGVEALIRWRRGETGLVPPSDFIPLAEQRGLICEIGAWVMKEACVQAASWRDAGEPLRLSVNISPRQFERDDLGSVVETALKQSGLEPGALHLELTETTLMERGANGAETLAGLRALGVRVALDDFGTGYSSLAYLRQFSIDVLKIDRSFIGGVDTDSVNAAIVKSILDLAHALDVETVAEGVETDPQWRILKEMGCDTLQGYLFGKPSTAAEVTALLAQARIAEQSAAA